MSLLRTLAIAGIAAGFALPACARLEVPQTAVSVRVPAGSRLQVALINGVSTSRSAPGDRFEASLVESVVVDGQTVLQKGAVLTGSVADVHEAGSARGRASLKLVLQSVERDGDDLSIETQPLVAAAHLSDLHYPPETRLNFTLASELVP